MTSPQCNILAFAGKGCTPWAFPFLLELLAGLRDCGCAVGLVTDEAPIGSRRPPFPVVSLESLPARLRALRHGETWKAALGCAEPEVVYIHAPPVHGLCGRLIRQLKAPVVICPGSLRRSADAMVRWHVRSASVIASSQAMRELLVNRLHVPREKVIVVPPGTTADSSPVGPRESEVPVVGTTSEFDPGAGVRLFLDAARLIVNAGRSAEFLVAGEGPAESLLRRHARKLGLSGCVTFASGLTGCRPAVAASDVFVCAEPEGEAEYPILEAMRLGRPVVALPGGGVLEMVEDGRTGLVTTGGNAAELAEAVLRLLEDPALGRALGTAAREVVSSRFRKERWVEETLTVCRRAASSTGKGAQA